MGNQNGLTNRLTLRECVLLSFQRALLGMVTPELRGVAVSWSDKAISGVLYYDCSIGTLQGETASDIEGEVIADFPEHSVAVLAKQLSVPKQLSASELDAWVYRRKE